MTRSQTEKELRKPAPVKTSSEPIKRDDKHSGSAATSKTAILSSAIKPENVSGCGKGKISAKSVASTALLASLAIIFSYVEAIIPYSPAIPGIKLGIANIVTVIALYGYSAKHAAAVNFTRITVCGLLFNGLFGAVYSLAGAILSLAGMILVKRIDKFSIAGVSMVGGVLHNLGQIIIASFLIEDIRMFYYFPVLLFSGLAAGIAVGITATLVIRRLPKTK